MDKHILFIGRLSVEKNLFAVLEAMINLKEFTLDIIGAGKVENELKKKVDQLNIKVNFLGTCPNSKLPEIINRYQIFILPSFYEGNPKVLLEAMSCGIACIGTNVKGIKEIIIHKNNGYLCKPNSNAIKNAIKALYNDKILREEISKNARDFIVGNFSLDLIAEKEYLLYKDVLK